MDINIVAGMCGELNNEHIFSLIKNRDKSKKHIILAPDRSLFSIEQRLFEETNEGCFFDVNVISLTKLSKQLLSKVKTKNILTKQSGVALIKKLLKDNVDRLLTFKKASSFMGFASTLFETICLYKSCNIMPEDIYIDDSNSFVNLKQKDIKLIYSEYEKYLQCDFTDSFNQLKLFADLIDKNSFKDTIFYFIEFDDFTRLMYNIILKLSRFSEGIFVTCTYGKENNNSNIYLNKVYYDLIDLYKSNGLEFKINKLNSFDDYSKDLILNNLISYEPQVSKCTYDKIKINSFETITHEIKYTIADIYKKVIDLKLDYSHFSIVLPSLMEYKKLLSQEFERYQIPYYFDESELLSNHILIRNIFFICKIILGDFSPSDFSNVLKSPLLDFDINATFDYDNFLKRTGAVGALCFNKNITENEDILEFLDLIILLKKDNKKDLACSEWVNNVILKIYNYLLNRLSTNYIKTLNSLDSRIFNQVVTKFENINKDFLSVFSQNITTFNDFLDTYSSYFETTNISLPPITSNTIFIADINSSYVSNVKYLYVLGCNEGKMPKYKLDNGLVTDEEIAKLPNANKINPTISMINSRKLFKLFELFFKFKENMTLSFLKTDKEGKLYPNTIINSLVRIFKYNVINCSVELDTINNSFYDLNIDNIVFNNLTPAVAKQNILEYIKLWDIFKDNVNFRTIISSLTGINKNSNILTLISNNNLNGYISNLESNTFFKYKTTSVSEIECFYGCPYKHYIRYGLYLKDSVNYKLKANDIGTIIHETLKDVVPYMLKNLDDEESISSKSKEYLEKVINSEEYKDIIKNPDNAYVIKSLYRELERVCLALVEQLKVSSFVPTYYEFRFNDKDKPLQINNISITGAIDRVDLFNDKFIIIDYKTGDNHFSDYNDVLSGKKLQLLVYAKAIANKLNLKPSGAFYLPISNGFSEEQDSPYRLNGVMLNSEDNIIALDKNLIGDGYKSKIINLKTTSNGKIYSSNYYKNLCISTEDFDYLLDFSINQVKRAIDRILLGEINPSPLVSGQKSACDYCDYKAMCNYLHNFDNFEKDVVNIKTLKELGEEDVGI